MFISSTGISCCTCGSKKIPTYAYGCIPEGGTGQVIVFGELKDLQNVTVSGGTVTSFLLVSDNIVKVNINALSTAGTYDLTLHFNNYLYVLSDQFCIVPSTTSSGNIFEEIHCYTDQYKMKVLGTKNIYFNDFNFYGTAFNIIGNDQIEVMTDGKYKAKIRLMMDCDIQYPVTRLEINGLLWHNTELQMSRQFYEEEPYTTATYETHVVDLSAGDTIRLTITTPEDVEFFKGSTLIINRVG